MEVKVEGIKDCVGKESGKPFKVVTLRLANGFAGRLACFNGEADNLKVGDSALLDITTDFRNNIVVAIVG